MEEDYEENFQNIMSFNNYKDTYIDKEKTEEKVEEIVEEKVEEIVEEIRSEDTLNNNFSINNQKFIYLSVILNEILKKIILKKKFNNFNTLKFEFILIKRYKTKKIFKNFLNIFNKKLINQKIQTIKDINIFISNENELKILNKKIDLFIKEKNNKEILREDELNFEKSEVKKKEKKKSILPPPPMKKVDKKKMLVPPMLKKKVIEFKENFDVYPIDPNHIKKFFVEKIRGIDYNNSFWKLNKNKIENDIKNIKINYKELEAEFKIVIQKEKKDIKVKKYLLDSKRINNIEIIIKRFPIDVYEFIIKIENNMIKELNLELMNLFKKIIPNYNEKIEIENKLKNDNYVYNSNSELVIKKILSIPNLQDKLNYFILFKEFKNTYNFNFKNLEIYNDLLILIENNSNLRIFLRFLLKIINWLNFSSKNENSSSITLKNIKNLKNIVANNSKNIYYFCIKYIWVGNNRFFNFLDQYNELIYNKIWKNKDFLNAQNELQKKINLIKNRLNIQEENEPWETNFMDILNKKKDSFLIKYNKYSILYEKFNKISKKIKCMFGAKTEEIEHILLIFKEIFLEISSNLTKIEIEHNKKQVIVTTKQVFGKIENNTIFDPKELKLKLNKNKNNVIINELKNNLKQDLKIESSNNKKESLKNKINRIKNHKKTIISTKKIMNSEKNVNKVEHPVKNDIDNTDVHFDNKGILKF